MSKNIINCMKQLSKNNALVELLINNNNSLPLLLDGSGLQAKITDNVRNDLINPTSDTSKIHPYPFNPEATTTDGSFIRIYYNSGTLDDAEAISESQINIDIIVAKSMWLINDGQNSMIRPYEIMGRVIDMLGKNSINNTIRLSFEGYQHLYINTKFDCIRLYAEYMSVEKTQ